MLPLTSVREVAQGISKFHDLSNTLVPQCILPASTNGSGFTSTMSLLLHRTPCVYGAVCGRYPNPAS